MVDDMIRLFKDGSTTFSSNGIGTLPDAESCLVTEERNGEYELEMTYPVTGKRYEELEIRRIIVAKPNPFSNPQPFRIYYISKPIRGIVEIKAEHISYDMSGYVVYPFLANTATVAFEQMKETCVPSCPFTFHTDVDTYAPLSIRKPSSMRSVLGGSDVSVLDSFGGEYEFDVYTVNLWKNRGQNRNAVISYGKNMTDFQQEENCSDVFTGVYPFWFSEQNGLMDLPEKTVYAEGTYDFVRIYPLDLSDQFSEKPSEEALRSVAKDWMKDNDIGIPKVSFTVSFVQLSQSEEYKNYSVLEDIRLCDSIRVEFPLYNVHTASKCIKTVYNVITGKYDSIELGDPKEDIASTIAVQKQTLEVQQLMLGTEAATKTFMQQAIEHATKMITGGLGGYVVFNSSTGGDYPDEILIMDTDNINTAKNVWRWNKGGLGHSSNGYNGPFETAITMDGWIVGKQIAANSINGEKLTIEYKESVTNEISDAVSSLKAEVDKEFGDVDKYISDINTELETTVADGIITESEKAAINKMLQFVQKEKEEADAQYNKVVQNESLPSEDKTNLSTKYTALYGASASSAYNALITSIQDVLNSDRQSLDQKMTTYRTNYKTYSTKVSEFRIALDAAVELLANLYAEAVSETTLETALEVGNGKISAFVSETVTKATTIKNDDGTTSTVEEAIKKQQAAINLNKSNIEAKVSYSEWDDEFASSIGIWWDNITISSNKINLSAVYSAINAKPDYSDIPSDSHIESLAGSAAKSQINIWWDNIEIDSSKIDLSGLEINLEGYTTINGTFSIDWSGSMNATGGKIGGWTINSSSISAGSLVLDSTGAIRSSNGYGSHTYITSDSVDTPTLNCSDATFTKAPKMYGLSHVSTGGHLVFASDGATLAYLNSSSKRYKDIDRELSFDDIKRFCDIKVVWAKYKDGYLEEDDERNGQYMPMLIAENVEECFPIAADHFNGLTEDWNYRIMIPVMLKMIQHLYEKEGINS